MAVLLVRCGGMQNAHNLQFETKSAVVKSQVTGGKASGRGPPEAYSRSDKARRLDAESSFAVHDAQCFNQWMLGVRDEKPEDRESVYQVVSSAFGGAAEAALVDQLRSDGDAIFSLVAEEDGLIVGHVLLSRMTAPFPALALAPVSVIPSRQRRGIGSMLVEGAVSRARREGWAALFVLGDPHYYARFGFSVEAAAGFASPYAGQHFMVLPLGMALAATGELRHALAFGALGSGG